MAKLDSIPNEMANPSLADRFHIIHEITGTWYSYWISLETIKNFISLYFFGFKITKIIYDYHDAYYEYTPAQYELVEKIILKGAAAGSTLEVTDPANTIIDSTEGKVFDIGYYAEAVDAADRKLTLSINKSCTIVIISNINI